MGVNAHLVAFFAVLQPGNMYARSAGHRCNGQVLFLHPVIADDLVSYPAGPYFFSRQSQAPRCRGPAGCRWRGAKRFSALGSYSPLACSWAQKAWLASPVRSLWRQQVGGLVQHRNVFVLIDHLDRRLAARRLFGRDHRLFGKNSSLIYSSRITSPLLSRVSASPRLPFTFNALLLRKLLYSRAARYAPGHAFNKAGKPHAVFVFACDKLFHGGHILFAIFKQ